MTEEQIKEAVSRSYFQLLASSRGFKVTSASLDHGVDFTIVPVVRLQRGGKTRFLESQYKLDFQLKATTSTHVERDDREVRYDLDVKTYNDMIVRRSEALPLHLVLIVLDQEVPGCVQISAESLAVMASAYWFLPDEAAGESANARSIRISIPATNLIHGDFIQDCYERLGISL